MLIPLLCFSCTDKNLEKEKQLAEREKLLTEKELAFSEKEQELQSLIKMRDSLTIKKDSLYQRLWPETVAGVWTGKTICTESTCPEYAIGDVRFETWDFTTENNLLQTKVSNKGSLVRTYTGEINSNKLFLDFKTDSTSTKNVEMSIIFDEISSGKIKGSRIVNVDNKCSAKFNIELSR